MLHFSQVWGWIVLSKRVKLGVEKTLGKITETDAPLTIASATGDKGFFEVRDAKRVIPNAGLISSSRNIDSVIYALIDRVKDLKR